jgi:hypothetical protein
VLQLDKRNLKKKNEIRRRGRYQIKLQGKWVKTKAGITIEDVCLFYELFDGTTGKVGPQDWRLEPYRRGDELTIDE